MAYNVFIDDPATGINVAAFHTGRAYDASALANAFDDAGYTVETDLWGESVADAMVSPRVWEEHCLTRYPALAPAMVPGYDRHRCDQAGTPLTVLDIPGGTAPGSVVHLAETDLYGRVRLWWYCCGAVLVEMMANPEDIDCPDTVTGRFRLDELSPPPSGVSYSVPCIGASWSLSLPCGHLAGEGCDCDTIAAEANA